MTGWKGEGGVGGEYDGECLFDDDRDDDKYNNDDKYDDVEDGNGSRGEWMMGGIQLCLSRHHPRAVLWQRGA